jgi:hypothetical protein
MERPFEHEQPNSSSHNQNQGPKNPSRRNFLIKALSVGAVASAGLTAHIINTSHKIEEKEEVPTREKPVAPPTSEKVSELVKAREKVALCVKKIQESPFMHTPLLARKQVDRVFVNPDFTSVLLAVEEGGNITTLHIKDVRALSKSVANARGKGVYVHEEHGRRYHISLEDTTVDVGVSNRFTVKRHINKNEFSGVLPVYATRRSRYEKKRVQKKEESEQNAEDVGGFVEYVTYTPPSSRLTSKEVIKTGREYVDVVLNAGYDVLSQRMTSSNQKILALCRDIVKRLAVVEHVDPAVLMQAEKKDTTDIDAQKEIRRRNVYQKMYAEYGLNQDRAFNHLINSVGAGGMMQIMYRTYVDVRGKLLAANILLPHEIPEDPNSGRKDPLISAIIAIYLCYDNFVIHKKMLATKRDDEIELALVSLYNGSPKLFKKIIEDKKGPKQYKGVLQKVSLHHGEQRSTYTPFIEKILHHDKGRKLPGSGEAENRNYVRKYLWLKGNERLV